jgi:hypothetical protein
MGRIYSRRFGQIYAHEIGKQSAPAEVALKARQKAAAKWAGAKKRGLGGLSVYLSRVVNCNLGAFARDREV